MHIKEKILYGVHSPTLKERLVAEIGGNAKQVCSRNDLLASIVEKFIPQETPQHLTLYITNAVAKDYFAKIMHNTACLNWQTKEDGYAICVGVISKTSGTSSKWKRSMACYYSCD